MSLYFIHSLDNYSFSICDTSDFSEYEKGGVATEVKETKTLSFVSFFYTMTHQSHKISE